MADQRFEAAVERATLAATRIAVQEVAARNRRRLRLESLLIGGAVAALVAIPTTAVLSRSYTHERLAAERAARRWNCAAITTLASINAQKVRREIPQTERFEHESRDRFGLSQRRFDELIARTHREQVAAELVTQRVARHNCHGQ